MGFLLLVLLRNVLGFFLRWFWLVFKWVCFLEVLFLECFFNGGCFCVYGDGGGGGCWLVKGGVVVVGIV